MRNDSSLLDVCQPLVNDGKKVDPLFNISSRGGIREFLNSFYCDLFAVHKVNLLLQDTSNKLHYLTPNVKGRLRVARRLQPFVRLFTPCVTKETWHADKLGFFRLLKEWWHSLHGR